MMLQIRLSDPSLQRKLGAVWNPTLAAFNEKIEGFEQARRTTSSTAFGNAISRNPSSTNSSCRNSGQGGRPASRSNPPRGRGERDRCLALRSKCFQCAKSDHMIPACTYPESVKCNLCGAVGHVTPVCGRRKVVPRSVWKSSTPQIRREIRRKITRRQLPEAPASAPAAPVRRMRPAALMATSSGSSCVWPESTGLQELVDDVVVLGELLRYDVAFRGVVAPICAVVCAVGVSSCYSSHRRSATYLPLFRSTR